MGCRIVGVLKKKGPRDGILATEPFYPFGIPTPEIIIKKSPDIINNEVKSKENADSEDVSKDNTNPGILERISNPFHALISKESGSNTEKKSNNSCKNGPKESESHNYEQVKFNPQCMKIENNDVKSVN